MVILSNLIFRFMKEKRHNNWVLKAAEEMDIDVDEEQLYPDMAS